MSTEHVIVLNLSPSACKLIARALEEGADALGWSDGAKSGLAKHTAALRSAVAVERFVAGPSDEEVWVES